MIHIIKRKGHEEHFDERKVYASVFAACLSVRVSHKEAEAIANLVSEEVKKWLESKKETSSDAVFKKVGEELEHLNKDAAFIYKTHRDLS